MTLPQTTAETTAAVTDERVSTVRIERGPVIVGFDAVRLIRLPNNAIIIEAWHIQDQCWKRAEIPPEIVMRAADADDAFLDAVFMPRSQRVGVKRARRIE